VGWGAEPEGKNQGNDQICKKEGEKEMEATACYHRLGRWPLERNIRERKEGQKMHSGIFSIKETSTGETGYPKIGEAGEGGGGKLRGRCA